MENSSTFHFAVLVSFWVSVKLWDISPNIHKSEKELLHVFFESQFLIKDITLPTKVCVVKAMVFPVVYVCMDDVWMWELYYEESWALKNWCFWTVVSEKTLESPLDCNKIQPV